MQDEKTAAREMAEMIRQQEAALVFERFTPDDAFALGLILRSHAMGRGGGVAIDITLGGVQLFHCAVGLTAPNNDRWVRRKRNTVLEFHKSSLLVAQEMKASGRTLQDFGLPDGDFALSGGGFPIRLKGLGVMGAVVVSGLPQVSDHQLIVDALSEYLHTETMPVPEPGR